MPGLKSTDATLIFLIKEHAAIWMVACLGVALSGAAAWVVQYQLRAHSALEFEWVAHNRIGAFRQGIENGLNAVRNVRDLFLASEDVHEEQFRSFALSTIARYRGIQALMWVPQVSSGQPESYFPVRYVEPHKDNERYSGLDLASDPIHGDFLEHARATGDMVVSGRTELLIASEKHYGFLAYLPVFDNAPPASVGTRSLRGYAVGIFRLDDLAEASIAVLEPRGVEFIILDESAPEEQRFLGFYTSRLNRQGAGAFSPGDWNQMTGIRFKQVLPVADRQWSITCARTPQFKSAIVFQQSEWIVMGVGLLFTLLITFYLIFNKQRLLERIGMQKVIEEREELFWQMTETVGDVFWAVDSETGKFLYVSRGYEALWGDTCEHLYADQAAFSDAIHPEDQPRYHTAIDQIRNGTSAEMMYRLTVPHGAVRWIRDCGFPVKNERGKVVRMVGVAEDITERRLAEQALQESEDKLRNLFKRSPDIIVTIDSEGQILMMNRSISELSADNAVGADSAILLPPEFRSLYHRTLNKAFKKGKVRHLRYSTPEDIWWEVRVAPVTLEDGVTAAIVVVTDVTENEELKGKMMRNARLASIGVLAAGVAHEINNPNNAIRFNASLLNRVWQDATPILNEYCDENGDYSLGGLSFSEARETLPRLFADIGHNAERVKKIVENLKHLARQDSGALSAEVDIRVTLEESVMILHNRIQKYTDAFTLESGEELPVVKGNPQQLEQVFINVILNALEALPNRKAGVRVGATCESAEHCVLVKVRDEGCGIASEQLSKLTKPFFSTKTEAGGTGLGLSISSSILERHGGSITFESEPGQGTTVIIKLPVNGPFRGGIQ